MPFKFPYLPAAAAGAFILFLGLSSGCAAFHREAAGNGVDQQGHALFLAPPAQHRRQLQNFLTRYPAPTEEEKIQYLLDGIRNSDYVFVRNRERYSSNKAIGWLRWKRGHAQYRDNPILTAKDFVERVADISRATGWPYQMILPDNSWHHLQAILRNELNALEKRLEASKLTEDALLTAGPAEFHESSDLLSQSSAQTP